jgi:hypothetical protein
MSADSSPDDPMAVETRLDLADFIAQLGEDLKARPEQWGNVSLERFLEALSCYVADLDGWCKNVAPHVGPERPEWFLFAAALAGAAVYE